MVFLLLGYGLAVWFVTQYVHEKSLQDTHNISPMRGEVDYIYVIKLNESYKYGVNTTTPSV